MDVLMLFGDANSVVIFTKTSCCMSQSIKTLLRRFLVNPTIHEIDRLPNGKQIEKVLTFVGGSNQIMSLNIQ
ncbi:hypothetical protein F511_32082 [Dorcoceras hygrometricum]|uniref:Glutaredoxin domain-containing protein n=1 Tax=Dorcoceras hygrometricum TaxID=472368 RepID=A0A2Z7A2X8_9LAMI|nr:hypothetical protein F511_32082 [Dorcoceras hygrometricum]